ncbi:hypothetical protein BGZ60DRAFT_198200 [Tricladium varicosporioides]|nr:hypothetical protein BGZ60DRAFT_198200 [Hymenoscyphus varicosporioides]
MAGRILKMDGIVIVHGVLSGSTLGPPVESQRDKPIRTLPESRFLVPTRTRALTLAGNLIFSPALPTIEMDPGNFCVNTYSASNFRTKLPPSSHPPSNIFVCFSPYVSTNTLLSTHTLFPLSTSPREFQQSNLRFCESVIKIGTVQLPNPCFDARP